MQITHSKQAKPLRWNSPPPTHKSVPPEDGRGLDTVQLSQAKPRSGPGLSTLQKIGVGAALTVALGGAFVAGVHFSDSGPAEPSVESQVEDAGRELGREIEDLKIDLKRGAEDFKTGWKRGWEDARQEPSEERELQRDLEDLGREIKRESEDAGREIKRSARDFWRELTK